MRLYPFESLKAVYADLAPTTSGIYAICCADFASAAALMAAWRRAFIRSVLAQLTLCTAVRCAAVLRWPSTPIGQPGQGL
jgi:hypothetical protein